MLATPEVVYDPSWYPDSGATSHLTMDENNLMTKAPYNGLEQVHMGNKFGISIKNVGQSSFLSPFDSTPLHL